jgi:hypothetical protein
MKEYADTVCVFKPCPCSPAFLKAAETSCYVISKALWFAKNLVS